jgi:hypothetical protein
MTEQDFAETADRYRRFAEIEARGRSPLYERLCIANDRELLRLLLELPKERRQPNLLLAAMRFLYGTPGDWFRFRELLANEWGAVRAIMLGRSTQTNEPARCAVLLPLLVRLPQPLALLEVGASAGLCLCLTFMLTTTVRAPCGQNARIAKPRSFPAKSIMGPPCRPACPKLSGERDWTSTLSTSRTLYRPPGWKHWSGRSRPFGWPI